MGTIRYTKERRQKIVRDFAVRHNGVFNPNLFLAEVQERGKKHPAFAWFEWDANKAARKFQLEQAREFARDLKVSFKIENVGRKSPIALRSTEMPMIQSPLSSRNKGGGYVLVDPGSPEYIVEHCHQAAQALRAWVTRYESALQFVGVDTKVFDHQIKLLSSAKETKAA